MSAHTPGPWFAECVGSDGDHENPQDMYEVNSTHTRVAEYLYADDARLIATAPDMLKALQRLTHPMADDDDIKNALEVIAKATGESA